ncbi:MAG TPA: S-layer homology domain-containing protein [Candidatus Bathyarchaeia archaeon]|nr:S-layer homology domain-containing protein [Candidatus Bathyarchaeia archaeon]
MRFIPKQSCFLLLSASLLLPVYPASADAKSVAAFSTTAAAVNAKLTKEQALQIATRILPLPADVELINSSFRSMEVWRPFPEWSFSWRKKGENGNEDAITINASIHADKGELTAFSYYEQKPKPTKYASAITREEAQKAAERFMTTSLASKLSEVKLYTRTQPVPKTPLTTQTSYNFHYVRVINGILLPENYIDITVDSSGKIINMQTEWNDRITFSKAGSSLSAAQAAAQFRTHAKASLSYFLPWEPEEDAEQKPLLTYRNPFSFLIDAVTGKPLTHSFKPLETRAEPIPVSTTPLPPLYQGKPLAQDEAVRYAQKLFDLSLYELQGANYSDKDYRGNRQIWNLDFRAKNQGISPSFLILTIDASNGDVFQYSKEIRALSENVKPRWTKDDLKVKAIESLRRWTPSLASSFALIETAEGEIMDPRSPRLTYQFQRFVNGVPAATGSASITFDAVTGELLTYHVDIGKENYPSKLGGHLSEKEAIDAWLKESEIELIYQFDQIDPALASSAKSVPINMPAREAKLVYRMNPTPFEQPYSFDAVTGEWRSEANGKTVLLHRPAPSDIDGHQAEKALLLMYEYDALSLVDGKILPDRAITRGEMIEMLMVSLNQGRIHPGAYALRTASYQDVKQSSRYFASVEAAVDRGLLDKSSSSLKPDEPITREELADMIVRALGLKQLSAYEEMFQSDLTDLEDVKESGAIVIVTTIGIMQPDGNAFKPKEKVSRAEAALSFVKFLEKRSELQGERNLY